MMSRNFSNLTGKILIASPYTMYGNVFYQSLIYVLHHSIYGSAGFILNRLVSDDIEQLIKVKAENVDFAAVNNEIFVGGPVSIGKGFFFHSIDYKNDLLFHIEDTNLAVSSNLQILEDIKQNNGPKHSMFIIGYTLWQPGEMEHEIQNNLWIVSEPDNNLIFSADNDTKWSRALASLGMSSTDFAPSVIAKC